MKIIIVDDEYASLNTFLYGVVDSDAELRAFMNEPLKAVDYVKNNAVDGAFLDINMPEINGVDLAEKLIALRPAIRIVMITGYAYDHEDIAARLGDNLLGFCHKPYGREQLAHFLHEIGKRSTDEPYRLHTFGEFDLLRGNRSVPFSSSKSRELLALLTDRRGVRVTMGEAISHLWPDYALDKAKILYRDAVWRLRKTLKECGLEELVEFRRANQCIHPIISCDLWDMLDGKPTCYCGRYLTGYDWSLPTQTMLDGLVAQTQLGAT